MTMELVTVAFLASITPCVPHEVTMMSAFRARPTRAGKIRRDRRPDPCPHINSGIDRCSGPTTRPELARPLPERDEQDQAYQEGYVKRR